MKKIYSRPKSLHNVPFHYCPGCGHGLISNALNAALVRLQLDPAKVVIVTDIGCSGLTDKYFTNHAFHGLHGMDALATNDWSAHYQSQRLSRWSEYYRARFWPGAAGVLVDAGRDANRG